MKVKRTRSVMFIALIFAVLFTAGSAYDSSLLTAYAAFGVDTKAVKTDADVKYIMDNGLYVYSTKDPKEIKMPSSIPAELTTKLSHNLNKYSHAAAMIYVDLETGFTIKYNEKREFRGASLVKAPYMMAVLDRIKKGEMSLNQKMTYTSAYYRTGTAQIPKDSGGESMTMTLKRVIEYLIYYSDNSAFAMLQSYVSTSKFRSFALEHYNEEFYKKSNWLTASGVAAAFTDLYKKSRSGDELYVWFLELMKQANENKFIKAGIPTDGDGESLYVVAHKYGEDVNSLNDAAIIFYKNRPYLLIILNDYLSNSARPIFKEVSEDVFNIHEYIVNYDK